MIGYANFEITRCAALGIPIGIAEPWIAAPAELVGPLPADDDIDTDEANRQLAQMLRDNKQFRPTAMQLCAHQDRLVEITARRGHEKTNQLLRREYYWNRPTPWHPDCRDTRGVELVNGKGMMPSYARGSIEETWPK
jgi:hypothetical protein